MSSLEIQEFWERVTPGQEIGHVALLCKTYPDLSIKAMQDKRDRELAIWYLLRFLDPDGNGKVKLKDLCALVEDHEFMSLPNLQRRLKRGDGVFWDVRKLEQGVQIRYYSLARVGSSLGVEPMRAPVAIPLDAFKGLGRFRAYLYATWLNQSGNPISRQSVKRVTGLPKQTQIRYEKTAHVHKEKNMGIRPYEQDDQIPKGGFVSRDGKTLNLPMPNTYLALLDQLPRGQLKKARRVIRGLLKERPTDEMIERCYFRDGKQATKCKRRARAFFVDRRRSWRGYHLWDYCQV